MALAGVKGTISGDACNLVIWRDLVQKLWQHGRVTDITGGELGRAYFQRLLVNSDVDLAPDPALGATMLAGVPLPFALDLDAGAVDQQVQRAAGSTVGNIDLQGLLAPRQRAEVGHGPVQAGQAQQALNEARRLPERHAKQHLHRQAGLYGCVTIVRLSATFACWPGLPGHLGIEPDRQRATTLQSFVIGGPIPGLVGGGAGSAHAPPATTLDSQDESLTRFVQQSRLAPKIVAEVGQTIDRIKKMGKTILLVEQNSLLALRLADRAYLFEAGEIVLEGTGEELQSHPEVARAYLGH